MTATIQPIVSAAARNPASYSMPSSSCRDTAAKRANPCVPGAKPSRGVGRAGMYGVVGIRTLPGMNLLPVASVCVLIFGVLGGVCGAFVEDGPPVGSNAVTGAVSDVGSEVVVVVAAGVVPDWVDDTIGAGGAGGT